MANPSIKKKCNGELGRGIHCRTQLSTHFLFVGSQSDDPHNPKWIVRVQTISLFGWVMNCNLENKLCEPYAVKKTTVETSIYKSYPSLFYTGAWRLVVRARRCGHACAWSCLLPWTPRPCRFGYWRTRSDPQKGAQFTLTAIQKWSQMCTRFIGFQSDPQNTNVRTLRASLTGP
jgi:hypothetical protein